MALQEVIAFEKPHGPLRHGCMAALEADKYLANLEAQHNAAPAKKTGTDPKP